MHSTTTMAAGEGSYDPIGFNAAFARQFRLLWMSRRPLLLMLGLIGILALAGEPWSDNVLTRLLVLWPVWLVFVGPLWAFAVWHNEGPGNRLYFWTHPVSRTGHVLSRLAAGAAWLWAIFLALVLTGYLLAALDGRAAQFGAISTMGWVSFFTGPLLGYLVISALTVSSDYPIRWFLGLLFGVPLLLSILVEFMRLEALVRLVLRPFTATWGLVITAFAPFGAEVLELGMRLQGRPVDAESPVDPSTWWIAMPLWVLFWLGVVLLLARRHPDTFPRLRRG